MRPGAVGQHSGFHQQLTQSRIYINQRFKKLCFIISSKREDARNLGRKYKIMVWKITSNLLLLLVIVVIIIFIIIIVVVVVDVIYNFITIFLSFFLYLFGMKRRKSDSCVFTQKHKVFASIHRAISRSSQCSTTGVKKAVVCAILSVGWCI